MAKIMNSSQVSIEFKPWTDNDNFRITRLQIMEQLGGEVAKGEIDMFLGDVKEAEKMITEQNTGTISIVDEKEEGISYPEINVYIIETNQEKKKLPSKMSVHSSFLRFHMFIISYFNN